MSVQIRLRFDVHVLRDLEFASDLCEREKMADKRDGDPGGGGGTPL